MNSKPTLVHGEAKDVPMRIGEWRGTLSFVVVSMDDYECVLGVEFFDSVKAILFLCDNSMCIVGDGRPYSIPLEKDKVKEAMLFGLCVMELPVDQCMAKHDGDEVGGTV